jgi:predicted nucleotidyltransferase component of viral defense system
MKMPMYDKVALGKEAHGLGFNRDAYEKVIRLTEILQYINAEPELNNFLVLKGGTAINLTIFDLPRLSVDIDLDFAVNLSKEETKKRRVKIVEFLGRFLPTEGYTLKDRSKRTHALDSFVYSYINAAGNPDNIKIEINYSLRCHVFPTVEVPIWMGGDFSQFRIRTLAPTEIFASKIVALSVRAAARDLYDLDNMIRFGLFDERGSAMLHKCAVLYLAVTGGKKEKGFDFTKLSGITERQVKTELYPMIRRDERFDFMAAKERVLDHLTGLMVLSDREATFLKRFHSGHYEPQLLFEDTEMLERIQRHPMAEWRIRQARQGHRQK